jgi:hypothetical protein
MVSHYSLIFTYSSTYLLLQVTGDNIHTAMAIAKQAGILHEDGILLTTTTINSNILTITTFL